MKIAHSPSAHLGVFKLMMIAIISVDSIRNLPIVAQYGTALVTFYFIAGIAFFYPLIKVSSFLADRYPHTGGSYLWVQDALGVRWGFVSLWFQWIYNIIWYPTIFAFISTILAMIVSPFHSTSHLFIWVTSLILFWFITLMNCFGIRVLGWVTTVSTLIGTLIPMVLIIALALYYLLSGHVSATPLHFRDLIPSASNLLNLGFFNNILLSLLGIEVIAMHAGEVSNPGVAYPRAFMLSGMIILFSLVFSALALCILLPAGQIGLIGGVMEAFILFFREYHLEWAISWIGVAIILGGVGSTASWVSGLARAFQVAAFSSKLPAFCQRLNRHHMPQGILITQACIFTGLMSLFLFSSSLQKAYWLLSNMTAQFALAFYIILFAAALKLFRRAGKSLFQQAWIILGMLTSFAGVLVGFIPPASLVGPGSILNYEVMLIVGEVIFLIPLFFLLKPKRV
jgi:amino acid transporter